MARQEEYSLLEQVVQMLGQSDEKKIRPPYRAGSQ